MPGPARNQPLPLRRRRPRRPDRPNRPEHLGAIASLDNPLSQAVAGALNDAFGNAPAELFGFDAACVSGGAFKFGSTYLSFAVPFPGGKLAAAEKLAAKGRRLGGLLRRIVYEPRPGKIGGRPVVPRAPEDWELPSGY